MGILSFLTASRLKAELTRQRDEIARMHQMVDMEVSQRQEAEKRAETQISQSQQQEELKSEAERHVRDTEIRIETLRQELDEKQRQRAETTEQNATLAERSSVLEKRLGEMAQSVQHCEERIFAISKMKKASYRRISTRSWATSPGGEEHDLLTRPTHFR